MDSIPAQERAFQNLLAASQKIVFFSGAGISTESGISDYRSQGGLWEKFQPITIQEFMADENKRRLYWQQKKGMFAQILKAKPNKTHAAILNLQQRGKLAGAITQNIDGLHTLAGIRNVLEIHGTNREVICLSCGQKGPFDPVYKQLLAGETEPHCQTCGGLLKPNTISFGQSLDPAVLQKSFQLVENCDLLIAAGSTLIVEPAASLPRQAKYHGASLVLINRETTPLDTLADFVFYTEAGDFIERMVNAALRN